MADADQSTIFVDIYSYFLWIYYYLVIVFNLSYIWKCPAESVLLPFYSENFSQSHLDCGVADGYFPSSTLKRPYRAQTEHELTLLDLNENALGTASQRVSSVSPTTKIRMIKADIRAPLDPELKLASFKSISMFNVFHCVPGGSKKWKAFHNFKDLLSDDGVLVGCTVLGEKHAPTRLAWWYAALYNRLGFFNNWGDTKADVESALRVSYEEVDTWVVGMMLLFKAGRPRREGNRA
ncbi:hypothetical protein M426DRAFT_14917 [Hypoxylon sp. CI-4A]|nr:hypothetical protein M426DRAFT_14917 [Hypoxylon sp. CI-4A]